jgi:hypothetical protein
MIQHDGTSLSRYALIEGSGPYIYIGNLGVGGIFVAASYILIIVMEARVVLSVVRYVKREFGLKIGN